MVEPARRVWVLSLEPEGAPDRVDVAVTLRERAIEAVPLAEAEDVDIGVLVCRSDSEEALAALAEACRTGTSRVVVVATASLPGDGLWRLLAAGADDVLQWHARPQPEEALAARLERWLSVEAMVRGPLVTQHLVGESALWRSVLREVIEVACFSDAPILISGETGTGKELIARLIHTLDPVRSGAEIVTVDCTTVVPELAGSELFGHERGAFTGAVAARDGAFALAHRGTLFLDEVGELSAGLQMQLLRVLQERTYRRVGSNAWRESDFRLICATNRDLEDEEAAGRFRRDLYHRICTLAVRVPSLSERRSDVLPLAQHFMREARSGQDPPPLDDAVRLFLLTREYPGNVRDLRNLVYRMMARHTGAGAVTAGDIPVDERLAPASAPGAGITGALEDAVQHALAAGVGLKDLRRLVENIAIRLAVEEAQGNLQRAAQRLAITDRALQRRRAEERRASA